MKNLNLCILSFCLLLISGFNKLEAQNEFWGMTSAGGADGIGTIFKTNSSGDSQQVIYSFPCSTIGRFPNGDLCPAYGKLYGLTSDGGHSGSGGVLFEYDPGTNNYDVKVDFDNAINGQYPLGSLILSTNNKMYGMTSGGGVNFLGVLFEYDPVADTLIKKIDFDGVNTGATPHGSLVEASNGKFYGTTEYGGLFDFGILFEYDTTSGVLSKLLDFDGTAYGSYPEGSLIQAANGKLYGMTETGGLNNWGTLFEFDPDSNLFRKKIDFDSINSGKHPSFSKLVELANGKLYGLSSAGGLNDLGVIFEYNPSDSTLVKKFDFDGSNNGSTPYGSLALASNNKLYGITSTGGLHDIGVFFEYNPALSTYSKKFDFDGPNTGGFTLGSPALAPNGKFYCMNGYYGTNGNGVLFEYDPIPGAFSKKLDFYQADNGSYPDGSLFLAGNGNLYGMTTRGGASGFGVLFEFDPATSSFTKKFDFDGTSSGSFPEGNLMQAFDGKLYGLTSEGGLDNYGTLFNFDLTSNLLTKLVDFNDSLKGKYPYGSLVIIPNGNLYGMTTEGGVYTFGVLFEYNTNTGVFTKKIDFDGNNSGATPYGSLLRASDNYLYGMTYGGGIFNQGVLFQYNPSTNTITNKYNMDSNSGGNPYGDLTESSSGKLYGMTSSYGANFSGTLFEYIPAANTFTNLLDFGTGNDGYAPYGTLKESSNGKIYGMAGGGTNNNGIGILFEFDPSGNAYSKKLEFNNTNGANPVYTQLLEINKSDTSSVWPGDCNDNLSVNNYDFLNIGLAYDNIGPLRNSASLNWVAQPALQWNTSFQTGVNHKHADTNGDGVVNINDSAAIYLNYGYTHPFRLAQPNHVQSVADLFIVSSRDTVAPGDPVTFEIHLATPGVPLDSIYGLAYTLLFEQNLVDTLRLNLNYNLSQLGTLHTDLQSFEKDFYATGKIETALCRTDQTDLTTFNGIIGTFDIYTSNAVTVLSTLHITPFNAGGTTATENQITLSMINDSVVIDPSLTGLTEVDRNNKLIAFPNPANDDLNLQISGEQITRIEIFDLGGRMIYSAIPQQEKVTVSLKEFNPGIITITASTTKSVYHKKILVIK